MVARKKNEIDVEGIERNNVTKRYAVDIDNVLDQILDMLPDYMLTEEGELVEGRTDFDMYLNVKVEEVKN